MRMNRWVPIMLWVALCAVIASMIVVGIVTDRVHEDTVKLQECYWRIK